MLVLLKGWFWCELGSKGNSELTSKCLVYGDLGVIVAFPLHAGLWRAGGATGQRLVGALTNNDVTAA